MIKPDPIKKEYITLSALARDAKLREKLFNQVRNKEIELIIINPSGEPVIIKKMEIV